MFLSSPESVYGANPQSDATFVGELYQTALGRTGSADEINFWVNQNLTPAQLLADFVTSEEGLAHQASQTSAFLSDEGSGAFINSDPTHATINQFVQNILQRPAGASELQGYVDQANSGTPLSQIESAIIQSPECVNNVVPIAQLYQAAYGREPDQGGLAFWVHQLEAGASLSAIATAFLQSSEGQAALGGDSVTPFLIETVIANALGRGTTSTELNSYLTSGMSAGDLLEAIATSPQAESRAASAINTFLTDAGNGTAAYSGPLVTPAGAQVNLHADLTSYAGATLGATVFNALPENGVNTIQSSDVITGHGQGSSLEIQPIVDAGHPNGLTVAPTMSGVPTVEFLNAANLGLTFPIAFDAANSTGVQQVEVVNSGGSQVEFENTDGTGIQISSALISDSPAGTNGNTQLTLTDEIAPSLTLTVDNSPQANGNFTFVNVTGLSASQGVTDLTVNMTSSNGASATNPDELDLNVTGGPTLSSLTINSNGHEDLDIAPTLINTTNDVASAAAVTVTGSGSLDLTDGGLNSFDALATFDGTGYGGDLRLAIADDANLTSVNTGSGNDSVDLSQEVPGGAFTVNTGDGDDALLLGGSLTTAGTFDGGNGSNTIGITDGAVTTGGDTFANFQTMEIGPNANPQADNAAGLAGGSGTYDLSVFAGLNTVNVTATDIGGPLSGDVTLDNAVSGLDLHLIASSATTTEGEGELQLTAFDDTPNVMTLNYANPGSDAVVNLDAAGVGFLDSEGNASSTLGTIISGEIDVHNAGAVTINSDFIDYTPAGSPPAAPTAEDANEITAGTSGISLGLNDASSLTVNASVSLLVDQADQSAPNLSTITITGSGSDVDLTYNPTALEGAPTTPDVSQGIAAPLTLVDASGLQGILIPPETAGGTSSVQGGNFHAIFTDTSTAAMTFKGAGQANLVEFHNLAANSDLTGGAADDYIGWDGGAAGITYHINAATDALVNNGAAPEVETGETGETGHNPGGGGGGEAGTLLSDFANPVNPGSTSVPDPGALGEATMESLFGFNSSDVLDISSFGVGAVVQESVDFTTIDAGAPITGFFSGFSATHDAVLLSDVADPNDLFLAADANNDGNYNPTVDPMIHLHNDNGLSSASIAGAIKIA